ncbi:MAG: hypothetical protein ABF477_07415 [Leuconostoc pseudomesenteroides]|uniref:hypothetical protein n=1 Tax=Leuconostoc pseudomesenteroides TaxID=33968 RepID=UPI0039E7F70E
MNISEYERDNLHIALGKVAEAKRFLVNTAAISDDVDLVSSVDAITDDLSEVETSLLIILSRED